MVQQVADAGDRRDGRRLRMLKGGVIAFSGRHTTIPCVLRDLSDTGARLQVEQGSAVPDTFELLIELDGLEVGCEVIWRKPREIGARFLAAPQRSAPKRVQKVAPTGPLPRKTLRRDGVQPSTSVEPAAILAPASSPAPTASEQCHPARGPRLATTAQSSRAPAQSVVNPGSIPILIAEDDPDDRLLMVDAFAESEFDHKIEFVQNGEELLQYVRGEAPYADRAFPGLILLDLNMPRMDGRTALMHLKADRAFRRIPVIVLTTSNSEDDVQRTYDLGVTAYISKPSSFGGLLQLVNSLNSFWTQHVRLPAA